MSDTKVFGGSGITLDLYQFIRELLPPGKAILELGSGDVSTRYLSEVYKLFSVEDKPEWLNKHKATYIHAPLVRGWYDVDALKTCMPKDYDLILVDGPSGEGNRIGFMQHLDIFNTKVPIIFDDTNRTGEWYLAQSVAAFVGRPAVFHSTFAILMP